MKRHLFDTRNPVPWAQLLPLETDIVPNTIETHALVFDDTALDYAYAANGAQGVGDTWSWVLKVNGRHGTLPRYFGLVYDDNVASPNMVVDSAYAFGNTVSMNGRTTAGADQYQIDGVGGLDMTGVQVITIVHRNVPTRRVDYFITRAGLTIASGGMDMSAGGESRTPLHVGVAAAVRVITGVHTPIATTYAPSHVIATALIDGAVTEAQAQVYSVTKNAKAVWTNPFGYWNMADIAAGAVVNRGSGTANPMTVVGPTASDLEVVP